ncbi:MAG: hypothetical protein Q4C59_10125 [Lachnospiraceae bacterium]|nr:hypothetical protein [Lachnospiraceae bacterium]
MKTSKKILCLFIPLLAFSAAPAAKAELALPDAEAVTAVQINTLKCAADKWGKSWISNLLKALNKAIPVQTPSSEELKKGDWYDTLCLSYEDGTKDIFCFFIENDIWYMEDTDGIIYENADFITDYITQGYALLGSEKETAKTTPDTGYPITTLSAPSGDTLELDQLLDTHDLRYHLTLKIRENIQSGLSEETAVTNAREWLKNRFLLYQYALGEGCEPTEEDFRESLEFYITSLEQAENYDEIKPYFEEAGTTLRQFLKKSKEQYRVHLTIQNLYQNISEEFRNGNDQIGDKVCENIDEYWSTFLLDTVYPAMEAHDFSEFTKQMDEAESFYYEHSH